MLWTSGPAPRSRCNAGFPHGLLALAAPAPPRSRCDTALGGGLRWQKFVPRTESSVFGLIVGAIRKQAWQRDERHESSRYGSQDYSSPKTAGGGNPESTKMAEARANNGAGSRDRPGQIGARSVPTPLRFRSSSRKGLLRA